MEARRIHAAHASVVEVIAEGQNKVGSHLLRDVGHFPGGDLLHGGDVGGLRQPAPVPQSQEPNGGPVCCKQNTKLTLIIEITYLREIRKSPFEMILTPSFL